MATKSKSGKISNSQILTQLLPQGHAMTGNCELTNLVTVHYYDCMTQTVDIGLYLLAGRKNGRTIGLLDASGGHFRPGHINSEIPLADQHHSRTYYRVKTGTCMSTSV